MPSTSFAFPVAFAALLGTPFVAPTAAWLLRRGTAKFQRRAFRWMTATVMSVAAARLAGVSTSIYELNVGAVGASFLAASIVGVSAFRLKQRVAGMVLGTVAVVVICIGLLLGTAGALAVIFVVGDSVPIFRASIADHRNCHVTSFGNATTSDGGYDVTIEYQLPFAPFIEVATGQRRFWNPSISPNEACNQSLGVSR